MDKTILVNKTNPIKQKQIDKRKTIPIKDIFGKKIEINEEAFNAFQELREDLLKENIEIGIASAFRPFEEQQEVWDYYLEKRGKSYCEQFVAPVGCSEHHTGLAIDFYIKKDGVFPKDDLSIKNIEDYEAIHPVLRKYGFILRYPKGKESITGFSYEPWHIRYVGKFVSEEMEKRNQTLEEYKKSFQGILIVNKEKNMTSYDVVNKISKLYGIQRVGHTGTLDPMAEGVLIVCIGEATKIVELLTSYDKEYVAGVKLGVETDTYDIEGNIQKEEEIPTSLELEKTLKEYQKTYLQEVPIYSAVKVNGKKLYEYARENKKVTLPKKEVTIYEIELLEEEKDTFRFRSKVSKGCYIRSLIHDIGKSLNTYATMTSLVRTHQGSISLKDAYTLKQIENREAHLYSIEEVLDIPKITVEKELEFKIKNGVKIPNIWGINEKVLFKNQEGKLLGIYEKEEEKLKVWKNFQ